ncbi:Protein CBG03801 [Caenorhabditis briggsae]|uniref:Cytochrome c oxidase polypeptide VIIc n=3 Tax=Caenorhabditis TaxID=6237 RepID=A0AAE9J256_CAEBR|nr:Protein CBG03801 [Caenorhabditis briggsae]PIC50503.1 hypothetical protein B9Z55_001378 [Caenorhabditis nigoni]ULU10881.1 hypothetical protein L3Y34_014840 [Caenorhabditis briggsae]UMM11834.1 hypothetical protein L5515_000915 [Caenorhabditis briggsae]CAP24630.1 Protein CBG03801 [Caenorhabditis briggsae]
MLSRQVIRPIVQAVRKGHSSHSPSAVTFTGQGPNTFVNDGWASARLPFHVTNKWGFAAKAVTFLAIGFWAPFIVVEYQLRKANQ